MKLSFSGHETFVCRSFWLKKGFDFMQEDDTRGVEEAVVRLGVGKNMVTAINFWLRGFGVYDKEQHEATDLGAFIFEGHDPFLEDLASLWLLQYSVVKSEQVYIFSSFFNEFTKERSDFTREHLIGFMKRKTEEAGLRLFSDKTYEADAAVFLRTYVRSIDGRADLEDETANLLIDLDLITTYLKEDTNGRMVQWYRVNRSDRRELPSQVLLFSILDVFGQQNSITFNDLLEGKNSPGAVFRLSERALEQKLEDLSEEYPGIIYSDTAGNRVLQFREALDKWAILETHYAN